ncbi:low temperature requirement protein A [Campylobacter sp. 19-13652]|uniref:low temperature requirement protein A n=1 Tax=Campylobacter sp. 19-13652 TaxID=2840180 RepID=UPI001C7972E2|nr:low temperature requirement protein A [Campylobacter sp. 19-13652]BCX78597.1 membrane protein [Campylobacter sp. 19-13652]
MLKKLLYQRQMSGRDIAEIGRVATPLELLFDLVYVVAIASAASGLHHALAHHHIGSGLLSYALAFFCIFWAWMNFTWFASAFDTDDVSFRLAAMVQMFGSIVFAAGVEAFFKSEPDLSMGFIGFVIMRLALAYQWLRAATQAPAHRKTAIAYAVGIIIMQAFWGVFLLLPQEYFAVVILLCLGELSVPAIAEKCFGATPWHAHHITERYGLLVIIVLGEGVLGSLNSISALAKSDIIGAGVVGFGALLIVFMLWWFYFSGASKGHLYHKKRSLGQIFFVAYEHYFIFAAMASVGAALEIVADALKPDSHTSALYAICALSVSVCASLFFSTIMAISAKAYSNLKLIALISPLFAMTGVAIVAALGNLAAGIYTVALAPIISIAILSIAGNKDASHH